MNAQSQYESIPDTQAALRLPLSDRYPGTTRWIYLDGVTMGLLPESARQQAIAMLDAQMTGGGYDAELADQWCRAQLADLVGGSVQSIVLSRSFGQALRQVARPVAVPRGGNVVLCSALGSPAFNAFWRAYAEHHDLSVREAVPERDGLPASSVLSLLDERTGLVALPVLSHARGLRLPLAAIGAACRARGVFFAVDASSSVGILRLDVAAAGIDAVVVAAEGNALGLHGLGFFCLPAGTAVTSSASRGMSRLGPIGNWLETVIRPPARRADDVYGALSTDADPVALAIAVAALRELIQCDLDRVEDHALRLAEELRAELLDLDLVVETAPGTGPVVAVGAPCAVPDGELPDAMLRALAAEMTAGRVRFAVRAGQLQFAFHLYNGRRDVMDVCRIASRFLHG